MWARKEDQVGLKESRVATTSGNIEIIMSAKRSQTEPTSAPGFVSEIFRYLKTEKRWWLTPIIAVLALLAILALLVGVAPVMPFIYTLF